MHIICTSFCRWWSVPVEICLYCKWLAEDDVCFYESTTSISKAVVKFAGHSKCVSTPWGKETNQVHKRNKETTWIIYSLQVQRIRHCFPQKLGCLVKSKQKENALNFTKILERHILKQKIFIYLFFTHHTQMKQSMTHKNKEKKLKERKKEREKRVRTENEAEMDRAQVGVLI